MLQPARRRQTPEKLVRVPASRHPRVQLQERGGCRALKGLWVLRRNHGTAGATSRGLVHKDILSPGAQGMGSVVALQGVGVGGFSGLLKRIHKDV